MPTACHALRPDRAPLHADRGADWYNVLPESEALKTRGCATTYSSPRSCSDACALKAAGCYAATGNVRLHWAALADGYRASHSDRRALTWGAYLAALRALPATRRLRLHVAGDLPGVNNAIDAPRMRELARAAAAGGRTAWTYTHKPVLAGAGGAGAAETRRNLAAIRGAITAGLTVNASADTLAEGDRKMDLGLPVAVVLDAGAKAAPHGIRTPGGRRVVVCPAVLDDSHRVTCGNCGGTGPDAVPLCARGADRGFVVGFPAHGSGAKAASAVANGWKPAGKPLTVRP